MIENISCNKLQAGNLGYKITQLDNIACNKNIYPQINKVLSYTNAMLNMSKLKC